jgi:hypothetical protein
MCYVGLNVRKKTISYCVKDVSGRIHLAGSIRATRIDLDRWMKILPQLWMAAMEATVFTGWIYDHLKPHAAALKVAHPLMLPAIAAGFYLLFRLGPKFSPPQYLTFRRSSGYGAISASPKCINVFPMLLAKTSATSWASLELGAS